MLHYRGNRWFNKLLNDLGNGVSPPALLLLQQKMELKPASPVVRIPLIFRIGDSLPIRESIRIFFCSRFCPKP